MTSRVLVVADGYDTARAFSEAHRLRQGARVALLTPTSHPGSIAGIAFDEVYHLTEAPLPRRLSEVVTRCTRNAKEHRTA